MHLYSLKVLWHERLAKLNSKHEIDRFVMKALEVKTDNSNYDILNRILDVMDAIRQDALGKIDLQSEEGPLS